MSDPISALRAVSGTDSSVDAGPLPNIPAVPATDNYALNNILSSVKLWIEKASSNGITGFATKQDLVKAGLIKTDEMGNVVSTVDLNLSAPPVPTGLTASGAMSNIILTWDNPSQAYKNHGLTEVWSAEKDDFGQAVLIGQGPGFIFSHAVGEDSTRYYWIRFVSTAGVKGPFNSVNGTLGKTAKDPAFLMSVLTEEYGYGSAAPFFQVDAPITINGVVIPAGTYMKSAFIHDAAITNAQIHDLAADKINAGTLSADRIGANTLTAEKINGNSLVVTNGTFSGTLQAATGTFSGSLSAATGTFAGRLAAGVLDPSSFNGVTNTYSNAGSFTVTVPSNSSWTAVNMRFTLQGAGGGGGGAHSSRSPAAGGGGGAGAAVTVTIANVTPGATYTLVIGTGGSGAYGYANGGNGGNTTFAGYSATGGTGGGGADSGAQYPLPYGAGGSIGGQNGSVYGTPYGGAGGSSAYGAGGAASVSPNPYGVNGNAGGSGAGGSGAVAVHTDNYWVTGGNGGNGYAIIEFFDPNSVVTNVRYSNLITWLDGKLGTVPSNAR